MELPAVENFDNTIVSNFETMKQLRSDIGVVFNEIDSKLKSLNILHLELVKTHVDVNFRFGLDSFHFQNKLIHIENENMKNCFIYIDNRIYCEYYKLHKMIYDYITTEICDKVFIDKIMVTHKKYTVYKDLEPAKVYDFHITTEICNNINQCIIEMNALLLDKKRELHHCEQQSGLGFNIHNLINEQKYKLVLLEEKINMFMRYLNTFHIHHMNYFTRLMSKLKLMNDIVNEDIDLKQMVRNQGMDHSIYHDLNQHKKPLPATPGPPQIKIVETPSVDMLFTPMYSRSSQVSLLSTISEQFEPEDTPYMSSDTSGSVSEKDQDTVSV